MRIAVTGASGFIGRHVLTQLASDDNEIVAVTRDAKHLADFSNRVLVREMDIGLLPDDVFDLLGRPDVLVHLAWDGLPNYKSLRHFETELPLQYCFLRTVVAGGLRSLVVTGTCFEYGIQHGPLSEDLPTMPNNPYGHAKDALRRQLEFLQRIHSFNLTWARLFYMYGEGQALSSLYPQLEQAVTRGDSQFNLSGGEQLRDYLPVHQVAGYLVSLALAQTNAGVVNVCSGRPTSIRTLVEGWLKENHWQIQLNFGCYPYPDHEPMAFWGDRRRLDDILQAS